MASQHGRFSKQLLFLEGERTGEISHWIYKVIRAAILEGRVLTGSRLPSTRELAKQLQVSRGAVVAAFQRLCDEGLARTENGSGTYIDSATPQRAFTGTVPARVAHKKAWVASNQASALLRELKTSHGLLVPGKAFRSYEPALDLFPRDLWGRVASRVARRAPLSLYTYGHAAGYGPLRRAIADYVRGTRGVVCSPEQVLITTGAQQGIDLLARILLNPGDQVWLEDPGWDGARYAFRAAGAELIPISTDREGLDVDWGRHTAPRARMAYVTPASQYPLGVVMSKARRSALLRWAMEVNSWIVEDEFDAEYRYFGPSVASLQSEDRHGSVLYVGTFSKVLFGSLRLGFLVLPEAIVETFVQYRYATDWQVSTLDQATLSEFIAEGHLGQHIQRMRSIYKERSEILQYGALKHLEGLVKVDPVEVGMRTVGWLLRHKDDEAAAQLARQLGLEVAALSSFTIRHPSPPGFVLGFASCNEKELLEGTSILAQALA